MRFYFLKYHGYKYNEYVYGVWNPDNEHDIIKHREQYNHVKPTVHYRSPTYIPKPQYKRIMDNIDRELIHKDKARAQDRIIFTGNLDAKAKAVENIINTAITNDNMGNNSDGISAYSTDSSEGSESDEEYCPVNGYESDNDYIPDCDEGSSEYSEDVASGEDGSLVEESSDYQDSQPEDNTESIRKSNELLEELFGSDKKRKTDFVHSPTKIFIDISKEDD